MQYFKGDELELKMVACGLEVLNAVSIQKNLFHQQAYESAPLGDLIYSKKLAPLTNAISQEIFRDAYKQIFDAFISGGTFESYLFVFRKIFGTEVEVTFTVPGPGKLNIDIVATGFVIYNFVARLIQDNEYIYDQMVDEVGDNLVFQQVKGFQTEYEVEQMLFEMVPAGIFTTITLEIGA